MLSLHRVRFAWGVDRQIEIEWAKGRGAPGDLIADEPRCVLAEREVEPDQYAKIGIPAIGWRDGTPPLFERFQLRENTEYFVDITVPIGIKEAELEADRGRAWPFSDRLSSVFRADPPRRWRETPSGGTIVSGQLRLKNHAGILDLGTDPEVPLLAEVVCRKLNYADDFQVLLNEVAEQLAELLLQYDSPLSFSFNTNDIASTNDSALLFQMRHIMNPRNLPAAVDEVLTTLHAHLIDRPVRESIDRIEEPEVYSLIEGLDASCLGRGGPLARLFRGFTPRELIVHEKTETVDTPENRYVKHFLEECLLIAQRLTDLLQIRRKTAAMREAQEWAIQIEEMLGHRRWSEVGVLQRFPSNSQVLQKRRGYLDVLKFDLSLRLGLELSWKRGEKLADGLIGDVRPVNEIYEYWCFFILRQLIADMSEAQLTGDGSFISVSADKLQVKLEKGKRSRVSFLYKKLGTRQLQVCLFYNRRFRRLSHKIASWEGSYTAFFDPDYSILVTVTDGTAVRRHWLHFDAKYRLELSEIESLFSAPEGLEESEDGSIDETATAYDRELARIHKRDDLFKMHTYRDGILSSRGAYILFPGNRDEVRLSGKHQNLFVRHPSAFGTTPGFCFPSVGAFDLCPGKDKAQVVAIGSFLRSVFDAIFTHDVYTEEKGYFS